MHETLCFSIQSSSPNLDNPHASAVLLGPQLQEKATLVSAQVLQLFAVGFPMDSFQPQAHQVDLWVDHHVVCDHVAMVRMPKVN